MASIDGFFATTLIGSSARITNYSASSDLFGVAGSTAAVSVPASPMPLPLAAPGFPTGSLELSGSASTFVALDPGLIFRLDLEQVTTITFDNVTPGETLLIHLP